MLEVAAEAELLVEFELFLEVEVEEFVTFLEAEEFVEFLGAEVFVEFLGAEEAVGLLAPD